MDKKFSILSFKYAWEGLVAALREEPNLKFHLLVAIIVLVLSFLLRISRTDFLIIILVIGLVISVELTNTAIEAMVDRFVSTELPGAKLAKDISAGAVLVSTITAIAIGILIFAPYIFNG